MVARNDRRLAPEDPLYTRTCKEPGQAHLPHVARPQRNPQGSWIVELGIDPREILRATACRKTRDSHILVRKRRAWSRPWSTPAAPQVVSGPRLRPPRPQQTRSPETPQSNLYDKIAAAHSRKPARRRTPPASPETARNPSPPNLPHLLGHRGNPAQLIPEGRGQAKQAADESADAGRRQTPSQRSWKRRIAALSASAGLERQERSPPSPELEATASHENRRNPETAKRNNNPAPTP